MSNKVKRKKWFVELPPVEEFTAGFSSDIRKEYDDIVDELERNGRLAYPTGEKVDGILFAIRVIQTANIRVFYVYGANDIVYGIHGYVKKTEQIPRMEMKQAKNMVKSLRKKGWLE